MRFLDRFAAGDSSGEFGFDAYEEGRIAYRDGKRRSGNPYAHYSRPGCRWDEGWRDEMWSRRTL